MNVFTFSGNLGRDAELRYTQNQTAVLSFSVAVKSGYGDREQTNWADCAMFGKRAEGRLKDYLTKGQPVVVSGELRLETYVNRDGVEKSKLGVNVAEITLIGKKTDGPPMGGGGDQAPPDWNGPGPGTSGGGGGGADLDDEIPF
jgi:single-strand DNA-binding protein